MMGEHVVIDAETAVDPSTAADPCNISSSFWTRANNQTYIKACMTLVNAVAKIDSRAALETKLHLCMSLLNLAGSDGIGLRDEVPPMLLRLGYDQRCYGFVKTWAVAAQRTPLDAMEEWPPQGREIIKEEDDDVCEDLEVLCPDWEQADVHHLVALTLLKSRLLLDMRNIVQAGHLEVCAVHASDITKALLERRDPSTYSSTLSTLEAQIALLHAKVKEANQYFWDMLKTATDAELAEKLKYPFEMGSRREALLMTKTWKPVCGGVPLPEAGPS